MITLIHTAEGELKADNLACVPGTKIQTQDSQYNRDKGISLLHPGLITNKAAKKNEEKGYSLDSGQINVAWCADSVDSSRGVSRIEVKSIEVVEEWTRPDKIIFHG